MEREHIGLVPMARLPARVARSPESRLEVAGRLAREDLLGEVGHALQDATRLIHVVADILQLSGAGEHQKPEQPRLHSTPDVRLHGVANHGHRSGEMESRLHQLASRPMEHIAIGFAQVIGTRTRARLQESSNGSSPRTSFLLGDRAPIVRIGRNESCSPLDALMRLGQFLRRRCPLAHPHVIGTNRIVGDLVIMQGRQEASFTDRKHRAIGMRLRQKVRRVHSGRVERLWRKPIHTQVAQTNRQVLGRRRGIIG